jgi:hypothetical protein
VADLKKYEVTRGKNAGSDKGIWVFEGDGTLNDNEEPNGENVYKEVGETVEMEPERAQALVDLGRLRPVATRSRAAKASAG